MGGSPIRGVGTEGAHAQCLILRQTVPRVSHLIDWRTVGVITCHVRGRVLFFYLTAARGTRPNRPASLVHKHMPLPDRSHNGRGLFVDQRW